MEKGTDGIGNVNCRWSRMNKLSKGAAETDVSAAPFLTFMSFLSYDK